MKRSAGKMWRELKGLLRYYKLGFVLDIKANLAYPTTFWFAFIVIPLWSLLQILFVETIYGQTENFLGYTKYESYLLFGSYKIVQSIAVIFFFVKLLELKDLVRGTDRNSLDTLLLKPMDSQLYITTGSYWLGSISSVLTGIGLVAYGLLNKPQIINATGIVAAAIAGLLAVILLYILYLFIQTWLFWFEYLQIGEELWFTIQDFGQHPRGLYGGWMGVILNIVIPVTLMASVPVDYLLGRLPPIYLGGYTIVVAGLFYLTRKFWQYSIKKYASVSS